MDNHRLDGMLQEPIYGLTHKVKTDLFLNLINDLNQYHYSRCMPYKNILRGLGISLPVKALTDSPFLPVGLFKNVDLFSIDPSSIVKTMTSSGTSGAAVSKIFVDKQTATLQTKVLSKIVGNFVGTKRLPMLIIDSPRTLNDRNFFNARTAAIKGFSLFGNKIVFALNNDLSLNLEAIETFVQNYGEEKTLIFGFTSMVYLNFVSALTSLNVTYNLDKSIVIHGGGWKKMLDQSVDNPTFKNALLTRLGVHTVHNYYGMVEQTGSIFFECEHGQFHCSSFSDIIIRRNDFSCCGLGEKGLIQLISLIPESYPGHNLLSEDIGSIQGYDDCACGRKGTYFQIYGRASQAELRGCSDAY